MRRNRVLVVEDHPDGRALYCEYLRLSAWDVEEAATAEEALSACDTFHPDVIVMDISLPGMNGIEATKRLKSRTATRDIPVVILSAYVEKIYEALSAGCSEFLAKPCAPSRLREVVAGIVMGRRASLDVAKRGRGGAVTR